MLSLLFDESLHETVTGYTLKDNENYHALGVCIHVHVNAHINLLLTLFICIVRSGALQKGYKLLF